MGAPARRRRPPLPAILLVHALVYAGVAAMALPLLWMLCTSLKTEAEAGAAPTFATLLPAAPQWANYARAFESASLERYYLNSTLAAALTTVLGVAHNALAGYAFAKLRFRGRRVLLGAALATMMVPVQVYFIFAYLLCTRLGYVDSVQALVVPFLASGFGIFYMRQAILAVPDSLLEAGRLDGMSEFDLFWHLVRPTVWPAMSALGIFTFVFSWNNFFWPLIVVDSERSKTLPLALADLSAGLYVDSWPVQMAAATIMIGPMVAVYLVLQRAFVQGVALTGMKE